MTTYNIIVACSAFIIFVISNVSVFLLFAKYITRVSVFFCSLQIVSYLLLGLHGFISKEITILSCASFGLLTSAIILAMHLYFKSKKAAF
jgi:hypothetical protein